MVENQFHEKFRQIKFRNTFLRPQIHIVYYLGIKNYYRMYDVEITEILFYIFLTKISWKQQFY